MMLLVTEDVEWVDVFASASRTDVLSHPVESHNLDSNDLVRLVEHKNVTIAVIGPEHDDQIALELVEGLSQRCPEIDILAFAENDPEMIRAMFRAGASDVLTEDMANDALAEAIASIEDRVRRRQASFTTTAGDKQSRVITALSPRGGVGRTLLSVGLGLTLERNNPGDVVVVDLDLQGGDVAPMLGLTPNLSVASLAGRSNDIDSADVKAILTKDESGLHVLAAPTSLTASVDVSPELITALLRSLHESFQFVVVDTPTVLTESTLAAIDESTDLLLPCAPDVPSVRALGRITDALNELEVVGPQRHLVVNKSTDRYGMPLRDIEAVSGMTVDAQIPAAKEIAMTLNQGAAVHSALQPRGPMQRAFKQLAQMIEPASDKPKKRRAWSLR